MSNTITDTGEMAEAEWDEHEEPKDVRSDIVATKEPEHKGMEFHVSLRDYTLSDMEDLIVEAAARTIVGKHSETALAKAIQDRVIALINTKLNERLAQVSADILNQPILPTGHGKSEPVTMAQFIGLVGREYLETKVGSNGKPDNDSWNNDRKRRVDWIVECALEERFKREIEAGTSKAVAEVRAEIRAAHEQILAAETAKLKAALAKITS